MQTVYNPFEPFAELDFIDADDIVLSRNGMVVNIGIESIGVTVGSSLYCSKIEMNDIIVRILLCIADELFKEF